ncbi:MULTISPECIES: DUF3800 domain-containing protein [Oceanobacillus]|uniref:DUF3800 domain-containing protein n=1 Tax=Oceanobacillus kimchii TaxID=746691 RepID=A0ABQ5TRH6_9BACI|nr:DUF3800 domain-containing protein [Oceanobacillus kimchii]GLO68374.1 hypothetical protein MACH08_41580 [Oceanobacillus kimchii]
MNYLIYFDESNKIDQFNERYSYYGAYGASDKTLANIVKEVRKIYVDHRSKSELHFTDYRKDANIIKYFKTLNTVLKSDLRINILIVNNEDALASADRLGLNTEELRNLFYIKIPERLFYGLTRDLSDFTKDDELVSVKLKIDNNEEYEKLNLNEKLVEQMNAHAAYRNKNYRVMKSITLDSQKSIPLQIIDTFMGIVVFLIEKSYTKTTDSSIVKSDLIYRLLIEDNIYRFQQQIKLFEWTGSEELKEINIGDYLSPFIVYKSNYDIQEIIRMKDILLANPSIKTKDLRSEMEYPNSRKNQLLGYRSYVNGDGRNTFLLS